MSSISRQTGRGPLGPEFKLIDKLVENLPFTGGLPSDVSETLEVGIGDDAAVWRIPSGRLGILTIDTIVEGIHAFPGEPPEAVGARALTAAVSDVAAMGGRPLLAVVALQAPAIVGEDRLLQIYEGIGEEASILQVAVVGGDVVDTPGPLALTVAVFGTAEEGRVWTRGGATPGEVIAVTGNLGGSRAGVELLEAGDEAPDGGWVERLIERHLRPRARVSTAQALAGLDPIGAAIDISDGLSSELWHIALGSGVGIHLNAGKIPVHPDLEEHIAWLSDRSASVSCVDYALDSGEEFELIVTLAPDHPALKIEDLGGEGPLTVIGDIVEGRPDVTIEGEDGGRKLVPGGYSHRKSE